VSLLRKFSESWQKRYVSVLSIAQKKCHKDTKAQRFTKEGKPNNHTGFINLDTDKTLPAISG